MLTVAPDWVTTVEAGQVADTAISGNAMVALPE